MSGIDFSAEKWKEYFSLEELEQLNTIACHLAGKKSISTATMQEYAQILHIFEGKMRELSVENALLHNASVKDSLTGLFNRRYYEEQLVELDKEEYLPLSVISVDVNNLKITNDILGHTFGDELLQKVGEILKSCADSNAIICRCGGDEFNIFLPNTSREEAQEYIKSVLEACSNYRIGFLPISVAMGCDVRKNRRIGIVSVFKNAEEMMYRHKRKIKVNFNVVWVAESQVKSRGYVNDAIYQKINEILEQLGKRLQLSEADIDRLQAEASLMYIGMVCIPPEIYYKTTLLSDAERKIYQKYPLVGYQILKLRDETQFAAPIIRQLQERFDGKGYPQGLSGEEIELDARLLSIVRTYMFLCRVREDGSVRPKDEIIREFETGCGTQFDPKICRRFIEMLKEE